MKSVSIPPLSHCIGEYENGDSTCDGDSGAGELACGWKDRCAAFLRHLTKTGQQASRYVKYGAEENGGDAMRYYAEPKTSLEEFAQFCDGLIAKEKKRKPTAKNEEPKKRKTRRDKAGYDKRRDGPSAGAKRAAKVALRRRAQERRQTLYGMFDRFKSLLVEELDGPEFAAAGMPVAHGFLYISDRSTTSNYISVYCKAKVGWDVPLIMLCFRTSQLHFWAELPVEPDMLSTAMSKKDFKRLKPEPTDDGRFRTEIKNVGKAELSLLAEVIAKLVDGGKIELPEAR
jgi:hypothetical protein